MKEHEMMDRIIDYQMRKITTAQVAKCLHDYTKALIYKQQLMSVDVFKHPHFLTPPTTYFKPVIGKMKFKKYIFKAMPNKQKTS